MNVTSNFREIVKQHRENSHVLDPSFVNNSKNRSKSIPEFRKKALAALSHVVELEKALDQESKLYSGSSFSLVSSKGSSGRRDQFDLQFQKALKSCADVVSKLQKQPSDRSTGYGRQETVAFIEDRIKQLNRKYNEQRNQSLRRRTELEKLSKFSAGYEHKKEIKITDTTTSPEVNGSEVKAGDGLRNRKLDNIGNDGSTPINTIPNYGEDVIAKEEAHVLEQENQQLYNEFTSILEDVQSIETKVVKIAELQDFFAENVLTQDADIQRIADTVVGSSENIKEGNEQIRKAMQNNAGSRIIVLSALIILGLSVLFLDWYND